MRLFKKTQAKQQDPLDQLLDDEQRQALESLVWEQVHKIWCELPDFATTAECPFCNAASSKPTLATMSNKTFENAGVFTMRQLRQAEGGRYLIEVGKSNPESQSIRNMSIPVLQWKCECGAVTTTKAATGEYPRWFHMEDA